MKSSSSVVSTSSSVRSSRRRTSSFDSGRNEVVPLGRRDEFSSSVSTLGLDDDDEDRGQSSSSVVGTTETPEEIRNRMEREAREEAGKRRHERFMANMVESIPIDFKKSGKMLACMICSLIKPQDEFEDRGCDNCERFLRVAGERGSSSLYTSENYEGLIGLIDPKDSWVSSYLRVPIRKKAGLYAVNVKGTLSSNIRQDLEESGLQYINQDRSIARDRVRQRQEELEQEEDEISKQRASRKIRRRRRRAKKAAKKNEKSKAEKKTVDGDGGEQSENQDEAGENLRAGSDDEEFEVPPESPAFVPPLTIIRGVVEGAEGLIGDDESAYYLKSENRF